MEGKIEDLNWMTGTWTGEIGSIFLEETWTAPAGATIAALIRMLGEDNTPMVELIVIEQTGDSLTLRVQQWNPGYKPRTPSPQAMDLAEMGTQLVKFVSQGEGAVASLQYSRNDNNQFVVDAVLASGQEMQFPLNANP